MWQYFVVFKENALSHFHSLATGSDFLSHLHFLRQTDTCTSLTDTGIIPEFTAHTHTPHKCSHGRLWRGLKDMLKCAPPQEAAQVLTLRSKLERLTVSSSFSLRFLFCSDTQSTQWLHHNSDVDLYYKTLYGVRAQSQMWSCCCAFRTTDNSVMIWLTVQHWLTRLKSHGVPGVRNVKEVPLCSGGLRDIRKMRHRMMSLMSDGLAYCIYYCRYSNRCSAHSGVFYRQRHRI